MNKALLIFVLVLAYHHCAAQQYILRDGSSAFDAKSGKWLASVQGDGVHASNAVQRSIVDAFLFGGHIDEAMKDQLSSKLRDENSLYWHAAFSASLAYRPKGKRFAYALHFGRSLAQGASFGADAAEMVFRGNAHFGEKTAQLGELQWNQWDYSKLQVGMVDSESGSFIRIGIYNGRNREDWQGGNTDLRTDYGRFGDEIFAERLTLGTEQFRGQSAQVQDAFFKAGSGAGLDAGWVLNVGKGRLIASVEDLGVMRWRSIESRDTSGTFQFEGFDVGLGNGAPGQLFNQLIDSISPSIQNEGKVWQIMPFTMRVGYLSPLIRERFFAGVELAYRHGFQQWPALSLSANAGIGKDSFAWIGLTLSDFTPPQLAMGLQKSIFGKSIIGIHAHHITGFLNKDSVARGLALQWIQRL